MVWKVSPVAEGANLVAGGLEDIEHEYFLER
jgi:hypothetical protein